MKIFFLNKFTLGFFSKQEIYICNSFLSLKNSPLYSKEL